MRAPSSPPPPPAPPPSDFFRMCSSDDWLFLHSELLRLLFIIIIIILLLLPCLPFSEEETTTCRRRALASLESLMDFRMHLRVYLTQQQLQIGKVAWAFVACCIVKQEPCQVFFPSSIQYLWILRCNGAKECVCMCGVEGYLSSAGKTIQLFIQWLHSNLCIPNFLCI